MWGNVWAEEFYTATLAVPEKEVTTTSLAPGSSLTSVANTGSNVIASKTSASQSSASNTAKSTGASAASTQGNSTSSHNAAMITGAPSWMLLAGAIAGVAVGA